MFFSLEREQRTPRTKLLLISSPPRQARLYRLDTEDGGEIDGDACVYIYMHAVSEGSWDPLETGLYL